MKTRSITIEHPKRPYRKRPKDKILTLKERFLAIKAYYRKPIYTKIAKKFKCDWEQIKTIIHDRKAFLEYYELATASKTALTDAEHLVRRQKLTFLGCCMYEYFQRAQYHKTTTIENNDLIAQAAEFSYHMRIKSFIPSKPWLKQFKISYKIPLTENKIELDRTPPATLKPKKIMNYCKQLVESKYKQREKKHVACKDAQAEGPCSTSKANTTVESESRKRRRQKINLLEKALYEYIQRAQYHRKILLNEDLHIKIACEFNNMLQIENFTPNKNWIKHFKLHFNINTSQRMIVVDRVPHFSLDLKNILNYCIDMEPEYSKISPKTATIQQEITKLEESENEPQKMVDSSKNQPETIVTLEFHNVDEVDIKPDVSDIEFEIVEDDDGQAEQPALKIQKIESMHVDNKTVEQTVNSSEHCSDEEEDIKPDIGEDIEIEIVDDDVIVTQPTLKKQQIQSMHVDQNTAELTAKSSDIDSTGEEDIKPDTSDIEFEIVEDDVMEVQEPALKIQQVASMHMEQTTTEQPTNSSGTDHSFQQSSDREKSTQHANNNTETISYSHEMKLEDQLRVLEAYDSTKEYSRIAAEFNCDQNYVKKIVRNREAVMKNFNTRSIVFILLGNCIFEYLQRAHYHQMQWTSNPYHINDDHLLMLAKKFSKFLHIANFIPDKTWLRQFRSTYNIHTKMQGIQRKPRSLLPKHIVACCKAHLTKRLTQNMCMKLSDNTIPLLRQQKIETLEKALYEYIKRSQYHRNMQLNEYNQIEVARAIEKIIKIDDFVPNKNWLKRFKLHYNINTSQRMIIVNCRPPSSLDLRDIVSYCDDAYSQHEQPIVNVDYVDTKEAEEPTPQLQLEESQKPEQQILIKLEVQHESEAAIEAVEEEKDVMDITIELPQDEQEVPTMLMCSSTEEKEKAEHHTVTENQNIASFQSLAESSDDEVLPKVTRSYADALKKLKSLEEFALLEENYRVIGLISRLEEIFKNPPTKSNLKT